MEKDKNTAKPDSGSDEVRIGETEIAPEVTSPGRKRLERHFFLGFLGLMTILFLVLMWPFFGSILWAIILSLILYPLHRRYLRLTKDRKTLAAGLTLLTGTLLVVIPLVLVLLSFIQQGADLYHQIKEGRIDVDTYVEQVKSAVPAVRQFTDRLNLDFDGINAQLKELPAKAGGAVAKQVVGAGQATVSFFFHLALMLYLAFFMIRDGNVLVQKLIRILPMGDTRERLVIDKFAEVTLATIKGSVAVAMVQGTLGGLIFAILGVGWPVLWGVVMTLLSLIPVVGSGIIWGPVAIYWFITGDWVKGLVLAGVGILVIGLVDNLLRPVLVGRETKMPDYLVLLSTISGIAVFGINGFIVGPLVAALFIAVWEIFSREIVDMTD